MKRQKNRKMCKWLTEELKVLTFEERTSVKLNELNKAKYFSSRRTRRKKRRSRSQRRKSKR